MYLNENLAVVSEGKEKGKTIKMRNVRDTGNGN